MKLKPFSFKKSLRERESKFKGKFDDIINKIGGEHVILGKIRQLAEMTPESDSGQARMTKDSQNDER